MLADGSGAGRSSGLPGGRDTANMRLLTTPALQPQPVKTNESRYSLSLRQRRHRRRTECTPGGLERDAAQALGTFASRRVRWKLGLAPRHQVIDRSDDHKIHNHRDKQKANDAVKEVTHRKHAVINRQLEGAE